jgi:methylenetetrahydrofolate dehydrogenase (NADP+)/methenyltetrahydrofolate cyclohydrolase
MTAKIIDGVAVAIAVRAQCKARAEALAETGITPGLALVIVGDDPASKIYVRNKVNACREVGVHSKVHAFPADCVQSEVLARLQLLNGAPRIHGVIVQLPVPKTFDMRRILETVAVDKDVDGFHLYNVGAWSSETRSSRRARRTASSSCCNTKVSVLRARMSWSWGQAIMSVSRWR